LEINGNPNFKTRQKPSGTREQQRSGYARRRTQNLSYRLHLYKTETLVAGQPFSGVHDPASGKLPEISIDPQYAARLNVNPGDTLTFDVQGVPIIGQIVNLRKVRWQSMQPNFYVIFQPGVLEDAPSTFLATIYKVNKADKGQLQNELIRQFPNISMVDISQAVDKALEITDQISWAIQVMAFASVFVGMIVVYSIARYNSQNRQQEINLLKVLGAEFGDIRKMILLEFGIFGFIAAAIGASLSLVASWIISAVVFESIWSVTWSTTLGTVVTITLLTMATAYLGTRKTLRQKPLFLLNSV